MATKARKKREPEPKTVITRKEDIPESFESEDAEVEFWEAHTLAPDLFFELQRDMEADELSQEWAAR